MAHKQDIKNNKKFANSGFFERKKFLLALFWIPLFIINFVFEAQVNVLKPFPAFFWQLIF